MTEYSPEQPRKPNPYIKAYMGLLESLKPWIEYASFMETEARVDARTGLYNVRVLQEDFLGLSGLHQRHRHDNPEQPVDDEHCIVALDIDDFKSINDRHGHAYGNKVLEAAADVMRGVLHRPSDKAIRLGGGSDEFIIWLPYTSLAGAKLVAELARSKFDETGYGTFSIGIADVNLDESLDINYARADKAMYLAKKLGRNRIVNHSDITGLDTELLIGYHNPQSF